MMSGGRRKNLSRWFWKTWALQILSKQSALERWNQNCISGALRSSGVSCRKTTKEWGEKCQRQHVQCEDTICVLYPHVAHHSSTRRYSGTTWCSIIGSIVDIRFLGCPESSMHPNSRNPNIGFELRYGVTLALVHVLIRKVNGPLRKVNCQPDSLLFWPDSLLFWPDNTTITKS